MADAAALLEMPNTFVGAEKERFDVEKELHFKFLEQNAPSIKYTGISLQALMELFTAICWLLC